MGSINKPDISDINKKLAEVRITLTKGSSLIPLVLVNRKIAEIRELFSQIDKKDLTANNITNLQTEISGISNLVDIKTKQNWSWLANKVSAFWNSIYTPAKALAEKLPSEGKEATGNLSESSKTLTPKIIEKLDADLTNALAEISQNDTTSTLTQTIFGKKSSVNQNFQQELKDSLSALFPGDNKIVDKILKSNNPIVAFFNDSPSNKTIKETLALKSEVSRLLKRALSSDALNKLPFEEKQAAVEGLFTAIRKAEEFRVAGRFTGSSFSPTLITKEKLEKGINQYISTLSESWEETGRKSENVQKPEIATPPSSTPYPARNSIQEGYIKFLNLPQISSSEKNLSGDNLFNILSKLSTQDGTRLLNDFTDLVSFDKNISKNFKDVQAKLQGIEPSKAQEVLTGLIAEKSTQLAQDYIDKRVASQVNKTDTNNQTEFKGDNITSLLTNPNIPLESKKTILGYLTGALDSIKSKSTDDKASDWSAINKSIANSSNPTPKTVLQRIRLTIRDFNPKAK